MKRKKKYKYINYILVLIICLSLGYAVLESSLSINGTTKISSINWHVYFDNIQVNSNSMQASTPAHIIDNGTKVEYSLNFTELGQSYEFTVDAINDGDYDAMIGSLSTKINCTQTNPISDLLEYSITYSDENPIQEKDILKTGIDNKENILVKVLLKDNISNNDLARLNNINISFEIDYVQADETANEVNHEKRCIYNGDLVQGAEFIDGPYKYHYMQEYYSTYSQSGNLVSESWNNINTDGWGVALVDYESTAPITEKICKTINNKPIVSTSYMFNHAKATSIDFESYDTSHVTNMKYMFHEAMTQTLNLNGIDASNVTDMSGMFYLNKATSINLSNFNTPSVTNMEYMFREASIENLDLSNFDTLNVTNMNQMFSFMSNIKTIDISSFNTQNVTNMNAMFRDSPNLERIYIGNNWTTSNVNRSLNTVFFFESDTKLPNYNSSDVSIEKAHANSGGYMTLKT